MSYPLHYFPSNDISRHSNERMNSIDDLSAYPREVVKSIAPNHIVTSNIMDGSFSNFLLFSESVWSQQVVNGGFVFAWGPCKRRDITKSNKQINTGSNNINELHVVGK